MANTELVAATEAERPVLRRLLQLYLHDLSEFARTDVDDDGEYDYAYLDNYWTNPERHPFLIRVSGRWAGFALVRACPHWDMAEFFVVRKYRRQGVGRTAARAVFASFPGRWEVRQLRTNEAATTFWRSAIPYRFDEHDTDEGRKQCFLVPESRGDT